MRKNNNNYTSPYSICNPVTKKSKLNGSKRKTFDKQDRIAIKIMGNHQKGRAQSKWMKSSCSR